MQRAMGVTWIFLLDSAGQAKSGGKPLGEVTGKVQYQRRSRHSGVRRVTRQCCQVLNQTPTRDIAIQALSNSDSMGTT